MEVGQYIIVNLDFILKNIFTSLRFYFYGLSFKTGISYYYYYHLLFSFLKNVCIIFIFVIYDPL